MEDSQKILSFANIDIIEYLNNVHVTSDHFLVETQKHNLKKYQSQLNEQLHMLFVANSDALMEILDTYKYCYELLETYRLPRIQQKEIPININEPSCHAFKKKCQMFHDDMSPFITESRYLVCSDNFNDDKNLLILTNDLLFIGEKKDKKYDLLHSFSNKIVDMYKVEEALKIRVSGGMHFEMKQEEENIQEFLDCFKETIYEYTSTSDEPEGYDKEYLEYLIYTEQIEKIEEYLNNIKIKPCVIDSKTIGNKISTKEQLKSLMKLFEDKNSVFNDFIISKFQGHLSQVNKIQVLSKVINESFDILEIFVEDFEKLCEEFEIEKLSMILCIEKLIFCLFESVEKRVFNKFFQIKISNENIELIRNRLKFGKYNYQFMIEVFLNKKAEFAKKCVESAKIQIKEHIEALFSS